MVSRHFDDYAKEVATSEPKGLQWKLNWTMHDHGATTLHLAADLPADLAVGDALPTATVDGHVLTVEVPKLFKRSVALPARLDNEGLEVVWDDARRRLLVTGRLKAGGGEPTATRARARSPSRCGRTSCDESGGGYRQ